MALERPCHNREGVKVNIRVSYAELETAAAQLGAGRDEINSRLHQLQGQIQNLLSSGFVTSVASGKFAAAYEQYSANAKGVIEQLTQIQEFLRHTAQVMQETDAQIASRIGY